MINNSTTSSPIITKIRKNTGSETKNVNVPPQSSRIQHISIRKSRKREKLIAVGVLLVILNIIFIALIYWSNKLVSTKINSYEKCAKMAGSTIQESYPEICITKSGKRFIHEVPPISTTVSKVANKCKISGCNGELCIDFEKDISTACLYKKVYKCYETATCEVQSNDECGWTQSKELQTCLDNYKNKSEGKFCGGIAGNLPQNQCSDGYTCKLDGNYPDAGGICIKN